MYNLPTERVSVIFFFFLNKQESMIGIFQLVGGTFRGNHVKCLLSIKLFVKKSVRITHIYDGVDVIDW